MKGEIPYKWSLHSHETDEFCLPNSFLLGYVIKYRFSKLVDFHLSEDRYKDRHNFGAGHPYETGNWRKNLLK